MTPRFTKILSEVCMKNINANDVIIKLLKKYNREDILIVLGGVIPENQHKNLIDAGVDLIFGPGSVIAESACNILSKLIDSNESRG